MVVSYVFAKFEKATKPDYFYAVILFFKPFKKKKNEILFSIMCYCLREIISQINQHQESHAPLGIRIVHIL